MTRGRWHLLAASRQAWAGRQFLPGESLARSSSKKLKMNVTLLTRATSPVPGALSTTKAFAVGSYVIVTNGAAGAEGRENLVWSEFCSSCERHRFSAPVT
jgi:hypothetical protein